MKKKILLSTLVIASALISHAQNTVSGKITSTKNAVLEGVSISVKNSYNGTTSAKDGSFFFNVSDTGMQTIILSLSGFKTVTRDVTFPFAFLDIQLKEEITEMKAVVLSAGSFEASDKKRTTVLKSVDVVTTAGQQADITSTLKTLPGTQQVGEEEGLFVRGGTGAETKVFIDGMMVTNPFFSSVPGIAQRSRFSPLLFKGTVFSSGGYSAQYGQGLSSALILESIDLPSRSEVNMIVSSAQLSIMGQRLNKAKNGSIGLNINYSNLAPYFSVVPQKYRYSKAPEALNADFNLRQKFKSGMLKFYAYTNHNEVGFQKAGLDYASSTDHFNIKNNNVYTNLNYTGKMQNRWQLYMGSSYSYNQDKIKLSTTIADSTVSAFNPQLTNSTIQSKIVFTKSYSGLSKLYIGAEYQSITDGVVAKDSIVKRLVHDNYLAGFVESDIYFSSKLVSKVGVRFENSSLLEKAVISPRLSLAYKLDGTSQFSFAYGSFYQKPETNFLLRKNGLNFTKATHYIFNYQKIQNSQTLRIETFYKKYKNLITTEAGNPFNIKNEGSGYAKGIELFWRDKTNIKNLDYWVSYSFLDTKRKYLDYPAFSQPSFAAKHTVSIVAKRFVEALSTNFSATYTFASGRPYYNPNKPASEFMTDKTMNYNSLGLQANYLRTFGKINAVFIVNVSNSLGSKQVFGYRYASKINVEGQYNSEALTPMAKRFVFVGMYLSIGGVKRKNIID